MNPERDYQVIIIGAGAAGLMCGQSAGQMGRRVLILDHAERPGKKILMSGGGSCNFTNLFIEADNYISNNSHFCKSALKRFDQYAFISLVEKHGIPYHERNHGQLFCTGKSREIVEMLIDECHRARVKFEYGTTINSVEKSDLFTLSTDDGDYTAESLVIATGGLSIPSRFGASDFGYEIAEQFGLNIVPTHPGLVAFTFRDNELEQFSKLTGISIDAIVTCNGHSFKEALLFTHRGLSGPVVLQASNYWKRGDEIIINLLPDINLAELIKEWQRERPKVELKNLIGELLTKRVAQTWLDLWSCNKPVNQYNDKEISKVAEIFHQCQITPYGTAGYRTAEVTRGGVDTNEFSSKTFESKKVPGLFFIGEVLDVTGWLGGFNLQWAWSSGYCAGEFV